MFFVHLVNMWGGWFLSSHTVKKEVMLHIRENKNEESRCARLPYNGVANLEDFRAVLEPFKVIPWPFNFWDSQSKTRIPAEMERMVTLEFHGHVVNVIRSQNKQSTVGEESTAVTEPTTVEESSDTFSSGALKVLKVALEVFKVLWDGTYCKLE